MLQAVEQRIEQVIHNLQSATAFEGKLSPPKTLYEQLARYHTPGLSIAVIQDFAIDWAQGFGVAEAGTSHDVTPDTLFQAGSISKPVFALAVMRLVQEGRLNLDEDVNTYLTSWHVPANGKWQPRVTLRHLLSHTAGTTAQGYYGYDASATLPTTLQVLKGEFPANSEKVEVNILPGLHYRYSGGGMVVGQQVLVDLLQKPFPDIMRELVFEPLGMTHSTYQQPLPPQIDAIAATAHPINGTPLGGKYMIYPELAAAGLWTTPTDLAKLGIELMGVLQGRSPAICSKETITEMLRPQTKQSEGGNGLFVGLGFAGRGEKEGAYFGHGGTNIGFVAEMRFYKSTGQGAIVMLNSNEGAPLRDEVMRAIGQAYNWADALPPERSTIPLTQTENYSGWYATEAGLTFQITNQDGTLFLHYEQQPPLQLFPTSELEFFAQAVNVNITFEQSETGSITVMHLNQAGVMTLGLVDKQIRAKRQEP
ncbi:serine hydrolase [Vacuolonema iberomarrocanum]|uniref:serine hydrolase n=1 Tax=Vacuolonema iberomarrocanum TaxID=3454632 RepID=UPI001A076DE2|nr:serine hydrolase [filamentous cyanobacterium LEGE 07170]